MRHAPSLGVDLPIVQARDAGGPVALRAARRTFDAFSLVSIGEMMSRTVLDAGALVPEATRAARDALRAVRASARFAVVVARFTSERAD